MDDKELDQRLRATLLTCDGKGVAVKAAALDQLLAHARIVGARQSEDKARLDWMQQHACEEGRTMAMPRYSYRRQICWRD
jgi:hypothetical protein